MVCAQCWSGREEHIVTLAILFLSIVVLFLMGMPIAFAIGMSSLIAILFDGNIPLTLLTQRMFFGLDSWLMMSIPLFMLSGELMSAGGMSKRLVDFITELLGSIRGSLAMISVGSSILFASISGSAAAGTAAVGSVMLPVMKEKGYNMKFATALLAAAGSIGPVIPPSIMLIVIGYMTDTSVIQLFLAGIVPGLLIGVGLMVVAYIHALKGGAAYAPSKQDFSLKRALKKGIQALPGLGLPFIIVFGILGGIFTVTEAAVVAVVYGFIVAKYIYRELDVAEMPRILFKSAKFAAAIILINATAFIFSWVITAHQLPLTITGFVTSTVDSRIEFCLYLGIIVLIIGMFMETFSATIIFAPLLLPIATEYGIERVHFGMILMVGWAIGYVTPPFGVNLFVSCSITGVSLREATPHVVPMVVSMLFVFFLIMFFPQSFTWLPNMAR